MMEEDEKKDHAIGFTGSAASIEPQRPVCVWVVYVHLVDVVIFGSVLYIGN